MTVEFSPRTIELEKSFWTLFPGLCKGCGLCVEKCPVKCISWAESIKNPGGGVMAPRTASLHMLR